MTTTSSRPAGEARRDEEAFPDDTQLGRKPLAHLTAHSFSDAGKCSTSPRRHCVFFVRRVPVTPFFVGIFTSLVSSFISLDESLRPCSIEVRVTNLVIQRRNVSP